MRGGADLQLLCDERNQLLERGVARSGEDVGASLRAGHRAAQPEAFDQIVDVRQVVEGASRTQHREVSAREAAEHLEEARVSRTVDPDRPRHDDVEAGVAAELAGQLLGFELGLLVDVAGIERRIFGAPADSRCGRARRRCEQ